MTDAIAATHALVVVTIMMYGFGRENYLLTQIFDNGCQSFFTPALIVAATLLFKFILWIFVRFYFLRDYSIDMVNVLRYLLVKWGWFIACQLLSASCIVFVLLLRHAGAEDVILGVLQRGDESCIQAK